MQGQDLVAGLLVEVGDEVGRVVRAHLLEDVGGPSGLEVLEDVDLGVGLHLLDRVGHGLVVEGGEDAGPVARRELVDDRRRGRPGGAAASLACGTRSRTPAIVLSTGSTSSQSM